MVGGEKTQETKGDLDAKFVVLAKNDAEECANVQYTSSTRVLVYTGQKGQSGHFYKASIPIAAFVDLTREVLAKVNAGEIAVEVE